MPFLQNLHISSPFKFRCSVQCVFFFVFAHQEELWCIFQMKLHTDKVNGSNGTPSNFSRGWPDGVTDRLVVALNMLLSDASMHTNYTEVYFTYTCKGGSRVCIAETVDPSGQPFVVNMNEVPYN